MKSLGVTEVWDRHCSSECHSSDSHSTEWVTRCNIDAPGHLHTHSCSPRPNNYRPGHMKWSFDTLCVYKWLSESMHCSKLSARGQLLPYRLKFNNPQRERGREREKERERKRQQTCNQTEEPKPRRFREMIMSEQTMDVLFFPPS